MRHFLATNVSFGSVDKDPRTRLGYVVRRAEPQTLVPVYNQSVVTRVQVSVVACVNVAQTTKEKS